MGVEGREWRRQRFGGRNSVYFVTRNSFTKYTRQSRHRLGTSPPSHSPLHILLVVSLSLLIQTECAHTRHQDRGSVLIEKGRRRGRPAESLPAEPPCLANALLLSPPRSIVGTLSPAPNRRTEESRAGVEGNRPHIFFWNIQCRQVVTSRPTPAAKNSLNCSFIVRESC